MPQKSDTQLLREYAEHGVEAAFAEIVTRHTNLVYSAAVRQMNSPDLAADVAQKVFIGLAQGAQTLSLRLAPDASLAGWLCRSARNISLNLRRNEFRQHSRERQAMEDFDPNPETAPEWERLRPVLDEAMSDLSEPDYDALVMRFFNNQDLRTIGLALGVSDDTAQKRVLRALDKLREHLSKRGINATAAALPLVLSANAVQAAPAGLALTISSAAILSSTPLSTITTATIIKTLAMTTLQKTLVAAIIAAAVGTGIYEARQVAVLRGQVQTLRQQQAPLTKQLTQLKSENQGLSNEVLQAKNSEGLSKAQFSELMKLRGKAGVAQADSRELAQLKSTINQQSGRIPDYLTNAVAMGMGTAEKWKLKDSQARVDRMTKALNLTGNQAQAISDIMQQHIKAQTQKTLDLMTGKTTPEQALDAYQTSQEAEIEALFTPEQLAAYPQFQQTEKITAADTSANNDATRIAGDFNLSKEQQEQIRASFYKMNLNGSPDGSAQAAVAAAKGSGNLADAFALEAEMQKSQLDQKLAILDSVLTPEQISTYRDEQMKQINVQVDAMKMFLPKRTPVTAN